MWGKLWGQISVLSPNFLYRLMYLVLPRLKDSKAICVANRDPPEEPSHQQPIEFLDLLLGNNTAMNDTRCSSTEPRCTS